MSNQNKISNRQDWVFSRASGDVKDIESIKQFYFINLLNRLLQMFEYEGLPDTLPQKELEKLLLLNGFAVIIQGTDGLYAVNGGLGGVPDAYYLPTEAVVSNPYLNINRTYKIDVDCVVLNNDANRLGVSALLNIYSTLLAHCDNSTYWNIVNSRIPSLLTASDDNTRESAMRFFEEVEKGRNYGVITTNSFVDSIKPTTTLPFSQNNDVHSIVELRQYLRASFWNDLGVNANYNMKREALNSSETALNEDALLPLVDDMMRERQEGVERINAMYSTSISVDFSSAWKKLREEIELADEQQENQDDLEEEDIQEDEETVDEEKEEKEDEKE